MLRKRKSAVKAPLINWGPQRLVYNQMARPLGQLEEEPSLITSKQFFNYEKPLKWLKEYLAVSKALEVTIPDLAWLATINTENCFREFTSNRNNNRWKHIIFFCVNWTGKKYFLFTSFMFYQYLNKQLSRKNSNFFSFCFKLYYYTVSEVERV